MRSSGLDLFGDLKTQVREEAEKGARKAVAFPVFAALVLAWLAYDASTPRRKKRRR